MPQDQQWDDETVLFDDDDLGTNEEDIIEGTKQAAKKAENIFDKQPPVAKGTRTIALVAVFDDNGDPLVARTVMENGKPRRLEEWRKPTPDEYNSLMWGGKIVRGGIVGTNVPTGTNMATAMQKIPLGAVPGPDWKKIAKYAVAAAAIAGAGYGIYWWQKGAK